jgi:hypothetical protein
MKPDDALDALGAARPHGQDDDDALIRRALDEIENHPEQKALAKTARGTDASRAEALQATPVPPDLKASLLRKMASAGRSKPIRPNRFSPWWTWAAAAVAVLAVVGLWRFLWLPQAQFDGTPEFRDAMAYYIAEVPFQLDYTSGNLAAIQQWLSDSAVPGVPPIPKRLAGKVPLGCKEIQWGDTQVSLICFFESIPERRLIHLFVAQRSTLSEEAIGEIEATLMAEGFQTRGWQTDEWVCVLVPSHPDMEVAPLLEDADFLRPV